MRNCGRFGRCRRISRRRDRVIGPSPQQTLGRDQPAQAETARHREAMPAPVHKRATSGSVLTKGRSKRRVKKNSGMEDVDRPIRREFGACLYSGLCERAKISGTEVGSDLGDEVGRSRLASNIRGEIRTSAF